MSAPASTGVDTGLDSSLDPIRDAPIPTLEAIAAVALSMAMKFHDTCMVKDGTLYQQYKLEGRQLVPLDMATVFNTAIEIERHLIGAPSRIVAVLDEHESEERT